MPKFIIERNVPGAGNQTAAELQSGAKESNTVLNELGPGVQWVKSYITGDKIYCEYIAQSEDIVREHARCLGVPANRISQVVVVTDPTTAEQPQATA